MFVNEIKARAFVLATCGESAGRVISNFDNRVEFELPPETNVTAAVTKARVAISGYTSENPAVGETVYRFDLGYGRSFFIKQTDKGVTAGAQQVFKASNLLLGAMQSVWQAIAEDFQEGGTMPADNEEAIELVLDANRLASLGGKDGKAADEELDALVEIYGYPKVDKELAKLVRFV